MIVQMLNAEKMWYFLRNRSDGSMIPWRVTVWGLSNDGKIRGYHYISNAGSIEGIHYGSMLNELPPSGYFRHEEDLTDEEFEVIAKYHSRK